MAITALDTVTRALQKLRVIGVGKEPKSAETALGVAELNDMLAEWAVDGIDLAVLPLETSDQIDVPDDHNTAIVLCLAARLGGFFGAQLSPIDTASLDRRMDILRAYHFSIADLADDNPLSRCNLPNTD